MDSLTLSNFKTPRHESTECYFQTEIPNIYDMYNYFLTRAKGLVTKGLATWSFVHVRFLCILIILCTDESKCNLSNGAFGVPFALTDHYNLTINQIRREWNNWNR